MGLAARLVQRRRRIARTAATAERAGQHHSGRYSWRPVAAVDQAEQHRRERAAINRTADLTACLQYFPDWVHRHQHRAAAALLRRQVPARLFRAAVVAVAVSLRPMHNRQAETVPVIRRFTDRFPLVLAGLLVRRHPERLADRVRLELRLVVVLAAAAVVVCLVVPEVLVETVASMVLVVAVAVRVGMDRIQERAELAGPGSQ